MSLWESIKRLFGRSLEDQYGPDAENESVESVELDQSSSAGDADSDVDAD